jgi:hypothetical protein
MKQKHVNASGESVAAPEGEGLFEMANLSPKRTGLPFVVWISPKEPDGKLAPDGPEYVTISGKSDGSQVRFTPIQEPDGTFVLIREIFDASGKQVFVEPSIRLVMTYYLSPYGASDHIANFESCPPKAEDRSATRSNRLGYDVVEIEVTKIVEREPPASSFAVPKGYTERSPSHLAAVWAARFPDHKFMPDRAPKMASPRYYLHSGEQR